MVADAIADVSTDNKGGGGVLVAARSAAVSDDDRQKMLEMLSCANARCCRADSTGEVRQCGIPPTPRSERMQEILNAAW